MNTSNCKPQVPEPRAERVSMTMLPQQKKGTLRTQCQPRSYPLTSTLVLLSIFGLAMISSGCTFDRDDAQNNPWRPDSSVPPIDLGPGSPNGGGESDAGNPLADTGPPAEDSSSPPEEDAGPWDEDTGHDDEDTGEPPLPPDEVRAVWVTRWAYSNSTHVQQVIDRAANNGFNVILFQVRGQADAYYASTVEPWASRLTGTLGQDPGWDPLEEAIQAAHQRGIELHAWLNVMPAWTGALNDIPDSTPRHVLLNHPDWLQVNANGVSAGHGGGGYHNLSPGIPGVHDHLIRVVEDIASRYPIDGLHLDYIRYAHRQFSHDQISLLRFEEDRLQDSTLTWEDWQRHQLTDLVDRIRDTLLDVRPSARLSAAVIGVNRDIWDWEAVFSGYRDTYQDVRRWVQEGLVDDIAPMIYHPMTDPPGLRLDFATIYDDHLTASRPWGVGVWAGIKAYETTYDEVAKQIEYVRTVLGDGVALFSSSSMDGLAFWSRLGEGPFATDADPPGPPAR